MSGFVAADLSYMLCCFHSIPPCCCYHRRYSFNKVDRREEKPMSSGSASDQMKSMKIADVGNGAGGEDDVGNEETKSPAILRIYGPDQKGIVAAFAQLLHGHGCNILDSEQHASNNIFFQRICFDYATMFTDRQTLQMGISDVCKRFNMESGTCSVGTITL